MEKLKTVRALRELSVDWDTITKSMGITPEKFETLEIQYLEKPTSLSTGKR